MDFQSCKQNKAANIEFIEKIINAQLPDHLNDPELFKFVKIYRNHSHPKTF